MDLGEKPPAYAEVQQDEFTKQDFVDLMKHFYKKDWMTGTGGAMGIRIGDELWISPSGVQKERIKPSDIFIYDFKTLTILQQPKNQRIKASACGHLFVEIMKRRDVKCVIHTHSLASNLVTTERSSFFTPSNKWKTHEQEYIKGIYNPVEKRNYRYSETVKVPIVENTDTEDQLLPQLCDVLDEHPEATAMLVKNHGVFVWGDSWEQTKIMLECYDYLFALSVEMRKFPVASRTLIG
ncbi:unnamed protein product, partial [Mesorhabditis belari]|uniref:Class II aldolase/adducin N-terminal domain-containing protein n=1 Tax=Mesorhabditis belari TaxID=2138241 RepID=A0AAF3FL05_9BILA